MTKQRFTAIIGIIAHSGDADPHSGDVDPPSFPEGPTEGYPFLIYQKSEGGF
jgi:hypothetical protein